MNTWDNDGLTASFGGGFLSAIVRFAPTIVHDEDLGKALRDLKESTDTSNRRMIWLNGAMTVLTFAILVLTGVLVWRG